ncbi:MAG: hypothetical protein AAFZ09_15905, partial [Pseudomonadota bacterium]
AGDRGMLGALALVLAASTAGADGVATLCAEDGGSAEACACAVEGLVGEIGQDEYALLHRLGFDLGDAVRRGRHPDDAWHEALAAENARNPEPDAITTRRAEALRRAHRAHLGFCHR